MLYFKYTDFIILNYQILYTIILCTAIYFIININILIHINYKIKYMQKNIILLLFIYQYINGSSFLFLPIFINIFKKFFIIRNIFVTLTLVIILFIIIHLITSNHCGIINVIVIKIRITLLNHKLILLIHSFLMKLLSLLLVTWFLIL